ncbi:hypothetical protein Hanom_Chr10g00909661 [Helianthus anomalus]
MRYVVPSEDTSPTALTKVNDPCFRVMFRDMGLGAANVGTWTVGLLAHEEEEEERVCKGEKAAIFV